MTKRQLSQYFGLGTPRVYLASVSELAAKQEDIARLTRNPRIIDTFYYTAHQSFKAKARNPKNPEIDERLKTSNE